MWVNGMIGFLMCICQKYERLENETFRLIPLDKNPGTRPIGIGEVLRRIIGKTISTFLKEEIKQAAGPLQVCARHSAGAEAAIHEMGLVFAEEGVDGILLIDASNAFNQMKVSSHAQYSDNMQANVVVHNQHVQKPF